MTSVEYQIVLRDKFSGPMNNANTSLQRFNNNAKGGMFGGLGKLTVASAAFAGIYKLGSAMVSLAANMEQTKVSFEVMMGSAEKANKMVMDLKAMADVTPFEATDLYENARMLMNFGMSGEKVIPMLKQLGDISGGDAFKLQRMTYAYSQASSAGRLLGQDLRQMIDAGFNPAAELFRTSGKSIEYWKKELTKSGTGLELMNQAFKSATSEGGRFYNMMEKQSKTLTGRWSTFKDQMHTIMMDIGNKMMPYLKKGLEWLSKFMGKLKDNFHYISSAFKPIIDATKMFFNAIGDLGKALFGSNKEGVKFQDVMKGIGKYIQLVHAPIKIFIQVWTQIITWIKEGVTWFKRMYDKFAALREIIDILLIPFRELMKAFKWVAEQVGGGDSAELEEKKNKLYEIGKEIGILNNKLKETITLAGKADILNKIAELKLQAEDVMRGGKRTMSWVAGVGENSNLGGTGGTGAGQDEITDSPYKITGSAPKVFNLNISTLIGSYTMHTTNLKEGVEEIKKTILTAIMESIVDVQTNVK